MLRFEGRESANPASHSALAIEGSVGACLRNKTLPSNASVLALESISPKTANIGHRVVG